MITYRLPSEEDKDKVRHYLNLDKKRLNQDVAFVRKWLKAQSHLPSDIDGEFLEKTLFRCKNSIERTKQKLESYFLLKLAYKDIFQGIASATPSQQPAYFFPLPNRGPNYERIFIWKLKPSNDEYPFDALCVTGALLAEIIYLVDYSAGERLIIDGSNCSLSYLAKLNLPILFKLINDYQAAFPVKVVGIELINLSNFIGLAMNMSKKVLHAKLHKRISCHLDNESLHKTVPKELLPRDYGGDLPEIEELIKPWDNFVEANRHILVNSINKYIAAFLPDFKKQDDSFAENIQGTFRSLVID